jgi:hypothetical protein
VYYFITIYGNGLVILFVKYILFIIIYIYGCYFQHMHQFIRQLATMPQPYGEVMDLDGEVTVDGEVVDLDGEVTVTVDGEVTVTVDGEVTGGGGRGRR